MLPALAVGASAVMLYTFTSGPKNTMTLKGPDGHSYTIQDLPDKEKAVGLLAEIRASLLKLHTHYKSEPAFSSDPPVERFLSRFTPDVFVENDMGSPDTSY